MEAAYGVGMLVGPMIGAFLFSFGGYKAPFLFFGKFTISITLKLTFVNLIAGVYLVTLPCIARVICANKPA